MTVIFVFLVGEGFDRFEAIVCSLALAATEPFVAMANQSKYEYVTFLLAVCGLLLIARRRLFPCRTDFSVGDRNATDRRYGTSLPDLL
jgi:hypothetical protein